MFPLPLSLDALLQCGLVELGLCKQPLEFGIFLFELAQLPGLGDLHRRRASTSSGKPCLQRPCNDARDPESTPWLSSPSASK